MIKVFGHISPDTDATGSAILWAWYLNHHTSTPAEAFVLGPLNKETKFVLAKWGISEPTLLEKIEDNDEIVVVDTNNPEELPQNLDKANIHQIIDHHRLVGGISTKGPINIYMKPLASTASVIHDLLGTVVETMPKEMAGLMLSCVLSDTLEFRSPTTTPHDRSIAEKLAKTLEIDIPSYAQEMFSAKSDVSDFTDAGLINLDSKKTAIGDKNVRVSVVETTDPASIIARKEGIVSAINKMLAEDSSIHDILFYVIDILKEESTVFMHSDYSKKIIEASFGVTIDGDTKVLPGIISRKKQIIPALLDAKI